MQEMEETWVLSLGWEDPLENGMATHSSILPGESPWTAATSLWSCKELNVTEHAYAHTYSFLVENQVLVLIPQSQQNLFFFSLLLTSQVI